MVDNGSSNIPGDKTATKEKTPSDTSSKSSSSGTASTGSSDGKEANRLEKPEKLQKDESSAKSEGSKALAKPNTVTKSPYEYPSNIKVPHGTTILLDIPNRRFYAKTGEIGDKKSAKSEVYPTIVDGFLELHPLEEFKKTNNGYQVACSKRSFDHKFPPEGFMMEIYQESRYNPPPEEHQATPKTANYDGILCDLTKGKYYEQSTMKRVYPFVRYPEQVMIFRPIPLLVRSQSGAQVPLHESLGHAVVSSDETGQDQYYYHYAPPQPIKILIKPWDPDAIIKN